MLSKWVSFWDALPPVVHTLLHVAGGAAVAYSVTAGVSVLSGDAFDPNIFVAGLMTAVGTAVVKGLNPADDSYGIGGGNSAPVIPASDSSINSTEGTE